MLEGMSVNIMIIRFSINHALVRDSFMYTFCHESHNEMHYMVYTAKKLCSGYVAVMQVENENWTLGRAPAQKVPQ